MMQISLLRKKPNGRGFLQKWPNLSPFIRVLQKTIKSSSFRLSFNSTFGIFNKNGQKRRKNAPFWDENNLGYDWYLYLSLKAGDLYGPFIYLCTELIKSVQNDLKTRHFWPKIHHLRGRPLHLYYKAACFDGCFYICSSFLSKIDHFDAFGTRFATLCLLKSIILV